ncbi:MAG: ABC transporter substrate-binding protein [Candidatus Rokuibacteriota bacterium]
MRLVTTRLATAVVLLLLAAPLATATAQPPEKTPRVGVLHPRTRSDASPQTDAFLQGLRELGWVEGKTIVVEYRWAEGRSDRLPDLVAELVRLKVDVIFAGSTAVAVAAKNATGTIPIVMATGGDPVGLGLVASLARPGGNVTGLSTSVDMTSTVKGHHRCSDRVLLSPSVRRHDADMVVVASSGRGASTSDARSPSAANRPQSLGAGAHRAVKGGAAAELGEGTLEAPAHAGTMESAMGSLRERTSNHRQSRSL